MTHTKLQLKCAILFFAKLYGKELSYNALLDANTGFPKIVEMIVYDMFLQKFCIYGCDNEQYEQYKILLEYSTELKNNGFVEYSK